MASEKKDLEDQSNSQLELHITDIQSAEIEKSALMQQLEELRNKFNELTLEHQKNIIEKEELKQSNEQLKKSSDEVSPKKSEGKKGKNSPLSKVESKARHQN